MHYYIDSAKCIGCGLCVISCPVNAISGKKRKAHVIDQKTCIKCGLCFDVCPVKVQAVTKKSGKFK